MQRQVLIGKYTSTNGFDHIIIDSGCYHVFTGCETENNKNESN